MNNKTATTRAVLANCILQKNRETQQVLGISWNELCVLVSIDLSLHGGHAPNVSKIADMATLSYTTATRLVNKLVKDGWITKNEGNRALYLRTTNRNKIKILFDFMASFEGTVNTTSEKLKNIPK